MTNLYLISQTINNGYDTYDSAVVSADSYEDAQKMRPDGRTEPYDIRNNYGWTTPEHVSVELIGTAADFIVPGAVICASFHAG